MGITASLLRIPAAKLDAYLEDSTQLDNDLFLEDGGQPDADLDVHQSAGEESIESLYLDKSWDGLIYLLSGSWHRHNRFESTPITLRAPS